MKKTVLTLEQISQAFNIEWNENDSQDWGIIYGDKNRLIEFINFFYSQEYDTKDIHTVYSLIDLIFSSLDRLLSYREPTQEEKETFILWLSKIDKYQEYKSKINYWLRLSDAQEFPIVSFLKNEFKGDKEQKFH